MSDEKSGCWEVYKFMVWYDGFDESISWYGEVVCCVDYGYGVI